MKTLLFRKNINTINIIHTNKIDEQNNIYSQFDNFMSLVYL